MGRFEPGLMVTPERTGRWPANVMHDGSDEVVRLFPEGGAGAFPGARPASGGLTTGHFSGQTGLLAARTDAGSAARFFYTAKATGAERRGSRHPTVKPLALMRYLVRLVTPPGRTVLDPFAGTGTTGEAALAEGCGAVLIEMNADYIKDIHNRAHGAQLGLFGADNQETTT